MSMRIHGYALPTSEDWLGVDTEGAPSAVQISAMTGSRKARRLLAEYAATIRRRLRDDGGVEAAIWVPDRGGGAPVGVLQVDLLAGDPADPISSAEFAQLRRDAGAGNDVLAYDVRESSVPAGALVEISYLGASGSELAEAAEFSLFPPDCLDALQLTFLSFDVDRSAELVAEARAMLQHLTVEVAPG
jgi:hypothetical protein